MKWRIGCALAIFSCVLTGCLGPQVRSDIAAQEKTIKQGVETSQKPAEEVKHDPLSVSNDIFTGNKSVRMLHGMPLPMRYDSPHAFAISSPTPYSLAQIGTMVAAQTGISVRMSDGADQGGGAAPGGSAVPPAGGLGGLAANNGTHAAPAGGAATRDAMPVAYEGSLSNFLDLVAGHFGVTWSYDGASIVFSRYETRTFVIEALPGTQNISETSTESDSSASSGSGGSSQSSTASAALSQSGAMQATIDYWKDLSAALGAIVGGTGTVQISSSGGTVTVITTPEIMRRVSDYISEENKRLTQQVMIDVELYSLALNDSDNYGFSMDTVFQDLSGWPNLTLSVPSAAVTASITPGTLTAAVVSPTSKFMGTSDILQALSTLGKVSEVAKLPMTTLNNRPAIRRIGQDIAYAASTSSTAVATTGSTEVSITPGTVHEGFSVQTTPRILSDGRILLEYSLSFIALDELVTFGSASTGEIQEPTTTSRIFVQQAILRSGSTLVLAGFSDATLSDNDQGVGNPFNILFGGSIVDGTTHTMLFIMITPREIKIPGPSTDDEAG